MKRVLALAVALSVCLGAIALAGDKMEKKGEMKGTITKVDSDQKMMIVKDKAGKEWTIYWNADTKVDGDSPKEGAKVHFTATEKDGKMWATWVKTGEHHKM
jgi:hypothetical protein